MVKIFTRCCPTPLRFGDASQQWRERVGKKAFQPLFCDPDLIHKSNCVSNRQNDDTQITEFPSNP